MPGEAFGHGTAILFSSGVDPHFLTARDPEETPTGAAPASRQCPLEPIRSSSNALLKRFRAAAAGREEGTVLIEGVRLLQDAMGAGVEIEAVVVPESRAEAGSRLAPEVRPVADELFERLGSLTTTPSVLALAREPRPRDVDELAREGAFLCVACEVQDPGNLGALARTAEAAGASGFVACGAGCRPFHPRALRGSMGSLLRLPVAIASDPDELAARFETHGLRQVTARTRGGTPAHEFDWNGSLALWLSGETGRGVPQEAIMEAVTLEMSGEVESLNVTAAAAVLLFQARQQRSQA